MPQNSSTLLKLMTSLSNSFQSCLPLGGLVNQSVQTFCRACLTLKLDGSSKTVTISSLVADLSPLVAPLVASVMPPSGEMGISLRGTCWSEAGAGVGPSEATSAMLGVRSR